MVSTYMRPPNIALHRERRTISQQPGGVSDQNVAKDDCDCGEPSQLEASKLFLRRCSFHNVGMSWGEIISRWGEQMPEGHAAIARCHLALGGALTPKPSSYYDDSPVIRASRLRFRADASAGTSMVRHRILAIVCDGPSRGRKIRSATVRRGECRMVGAWQSVSHASGEASLLTREPGILCSMIGRQWLDWADANDVVEFKKIDYSNAWGVQIGTNVAL